MGSSQKFTLRQLSVDSSEVKVKPAALAKLANHYAGQHHYHGGFE
jgi:hypothetical protein